MSVSSGSGEITYALALKKNKQLLSILAAALFVKRVKHRKEKQ